MSSITRKIILNRIYDWICTKTDCTVNALTENNFRDLMVSHVGHISYCIGHELVIYAWQNLFEVDIYSSNGVSIYEGHANMYTITQIKYIAGGIIYG